MEYKPLQSAKNISKYPVSLIEIVEDEKGQREDIAEVSQSQVEHVDGDAAPRSHVAHEHPNGQAVSHQSCDENHDVNSGQVVELETCLCEGTSSSCLVVEICHIQQGGQVQVCGHGVRGTHWSVYCMTGMDIHLSD